MNRKGEKRINYRKIRAWVKTAGSTYTGDIYLPADKSRLSDIMNDERKFLSMTDVESKDFAVPKAFVAINKDLIEMVELLEPDGETLP